MNNVQRLRRAHGLSQKEVAAYLGATREHIAAKLLLAEHRRAVRILARLEKERQLNQFDMAQWEKIGYLKAIADIRTALQKGRT